MSIEDIQPPRNEPPRVTQKFIGANVFYLLIVHLWALGLPPMGRDFQWPLPASPTPGVPDPIVVLHAVLGELDFLYQAVNILALWACMICVFFLTRLAVRGPWWLGSLAATLLMANPVKTEAVLLHSGFADLLSAFLALLSLTLYACHAAHPRASRLAGAILCFALASLFERNFLLAGVFVLYEWLLVPKDARRLRRLVPFIAITLLAVVLQGRILTHWQDIELLPMLLPLYLILYPIGLLPETMHAIAEEPIRFWLSAVAILLFLWLIHRKTRHPALPFAVAGMVLLRMWQPMVEPVHLEGGGTLLVPAALFYIAVAAIVRQMIQHPKWLRPMVTITTLVAVFFMGLQVYTIFQWREAVATTDLLRHHLSDWMKDHSDSPVVLAPAYMYAGLAPIDLADVFGEELGAQPLAWHVPLHWVPGMRSSVRKEGQDLRIEIRGAAPYAVAGWPYTLDQVGETHLADECRMTLESLDEESFVLRAAPTNPLAEGVLFVPALNDPPPGG